MPALPKIGRVLSMIGEAEILRERYPDHLGRADGHVGISREIEIDLQAERDGQEPIIQAGIGAADLREKTLVDEATQKGRRKDSSARGPRSDGPGRTSASTGSNSFVKLSWGASSRKRTIGPAITWGQNMSERQQVRETGGLRAPLTSVDEIADGLERVEGNPQRNRHLQERSCGIEPEAAFDRGHWGVANTAGKRGEKSGTRERIRRLLPKTRGGDRSQAHNVAP